MKNRRLFALLLRFSVFFALPFSLSCKKETVVDYKPFPLELTITDVAGGAKLSWSKVETSDFVEYTLVRSTGDSIPDLNLITTNPLASVVTRATDAKLTSFVDTRVLQQPVRTYFRVFARLNGRTLSSRNIITNTELFDLGNTFNEIIYNNTPTKPRFYLSGSFSTSIICFDAIGERISGTNLATATSNMRLAVASKNGENEELLAISPSSSFTSILSFFEGSTLKANGNLTLVNNGLIAGIIGTNDGFFIVVTTETSNNVKVISTQTHTIISQTTINFGGVSAGSVLMKTPNQRELIMRDPAGSLFVRISKIAYSEQGQILDSGLMGVANVSFNSPIPILRLSSNGSFFLINSSFQTRALQTQGSLVTGSGSFHTDFSIDPKTDKIYGFTPNTTGVSNVEEFDPISLKITKTIATKMTGLRCFNIDNGLVLFSNGNLTGRTVAQKIKL
jgi:hypothetical protein